jgi:hypothetical protein
VKSTAKLPHKKIGAILQIASDLIKLIGFKAGGADLIANGLQ